jgi:hypothetical protein
MAGSVSYRISSGRDIVADSTLPRQECADVLNHRLPTRPQKVRFQLLSAVVDKCAPKNSQSHVPTGRHKSQNIFDFIGAPRRLPKSGVNDTTLVNPDLELLT